VLSTSQTIKKYGLDAKKSLGQNFILDANLTDKIARQAGDLDGFQVLEIGGGPGGLTKSILKLNPQKLTVVEQDDRCIGALNEIKNFYPNQLEVIKGDALKFDISTIMLSSQPRVVALDKLQLGSWGVGRDPNFRQDDDKNRQIKIIANLPYNIATQLLFKWLEEKDKIDMMVLMFQKEVVDRIVAKPNSKAFGRLSVMVNFFCETKKLFDISSSSFTPPPKVTSSLVMIKPRVKPIMDIDFKELEKVCAAAFSQRRKMIRSSLKSISSDPEGWLKRSGIDSSLRAEQLTLDQFGKLVINFV
jgi:16S rRNA (adenine1518-N6/adenine1519-N6)-dimethyltransferase